MTAWEEYLAAAQLLDASRRRASTAAAEQAGAVRAGREELARVRQRLALQQARFADVTARHRVRAPDLAPTEAEVNAALAAGTGPAPVLAALRHATSTLDSADADLATVDTPRAGRRSTEATGRPTTIRNLLVYGAYAAAVLVLQVVLFVLASDQSLPLLAPVCGLVLPLMAYGLGWLTVGLVYPAPAGGRVDRTPLLGAVVCLVVPVLLSCAGIGALALSR